LEISNLIQILKIRKNYFNEHITRNMGQEK